MSLSRDYKIVTNEIDPYSVPANVSFDYVLDEKQTYAPIGLESKKMNSSPFNGAFLPGHNIFPIRRIDSIRKEGDEILVDVIIPDVEKPRTINANLLRQLCPDMFIDFLLENTDL